MGLTKDARPISSLYLVTPRHPVPTRQHDVLRSFPGAGSIQHFHSVFAVYEGEEASSQEC